MKICIRCKVEKPVTEYFKDKRVKCGLCGHCKECHYKSQVQYKIDKADQIREYYRRWSKENPERGKVYRNSENGRKTRSRYRENNADKIRKRLVKYREINYERVREMQKRHAANLTDCYVRGRLVSKGFWKEEITPEIIALFKSILKIKQYVRAEKKQKSV